MEPAPVTTSITPSKWSLRWVTAGPAIVTTLAVVAMSIIACLAYQSVYAGSAALVHIIVAAVGAAASSRLSQRFRLLAPEALLASIIAFVVLGTVTTQWVVTLSSPGDFLAALATGWADLLSSQLPATMNGPRSAVPFTTAWVATTVAHELAIRSRHAPMALIGGLLGVLAAGLFSPEVRSIAWFQGPALLCLALLLGLLNQTDRTHTAISIVDTTNRQGRRSAPIVLLALIVAIAALVTPRLGLVEEAERFDLRDYRENPWDPLDVPSPLVTLKASLKEDAPDDVVFRVRSATPITRFTLAVLATYDGVVWQVADPTTDTAAQFVPVDPLLPALGSQPLDGEPIEATIEIGSLTGPWIPHGGDPVLVDFGNERNLRLNLETRTLADPAGLQAGDTFALTTRLRPESISLREATFLPDDRSTDVQFVPAPILNLTADLVESIDFGGEQVEAIRDLFTEQGFYDSSRATPPGHSYARIASFIDDRDKVVGYEEQYAATAAVLARLASIPTRVVVGYRLNDSDYVGGVAEVVPDQIAAWIEVDVQGVGWVPVDVTPDRSREPTEDEIGRETREVAVPNDPPPPPPPQQSEEEDEAEDGEEDEPDEDEDAAEEGGSALAFFTARPGLVAGTVALSPFLLLALLAGVTLVLKTWRRNKRRNAGNPRLQVAGAWAEIVDRLQEIGHPIAPQSTPTEIVAQLAEHPDLAAASEELRELADLLSASAFARDDPDGAAVERAWKRVEEASEIATGSLGLLERTRMAIDPRPLLRRGPTER